MKQTRKNVADCSSEELGLLVFEKTQILLQIQADLTTIQDELNRRINLPKDGKEHADSHIEESDTAQPPQD